MAEMSPNRKRIAVLIVVVGSALIGERVMTLMSDGAEVVEPAVASRGKPRSTLASSAAATTPPSATVVQLERLAARQRALADASAAAAPARTPQAALFEPVAWLSAAAIAQAAAPPPPPPMPVVPPFPYAYLGGLLEDGVRTNFFTKGDRVLPVQAGDTVDALYRVDQMTEKQMTLTYLPLNQSLTLALGSAR